MKVLVTGATGFVGSHLVESLVEDSIETFGLARSLDKWNNFSLPGTPILGDLGVESLEHWIEDLPEDLTHVVHTAGVVHSFNPDVFFKVNTRGTKALFKKLIERFPKLHFVFISSLAAAGPSKDGLPLHEMSPLEPTSLYGQSKKEAEEFLKNNLPPNWSLTIIRPPMVIGPRDPAVLDIFKMVKSRLVLETGLGGRKKQYSFVCVHDVVGIIKKALSKDHQNLATYFTAFPEVVSFKSLIREISSQMERSPVIMPIPFPAISGIAYTMAAIKKVLPVEFRLTPDKLHELRPDAWLCSGQKATDELNFDYKWDIKQTIQITLADYRERGWL
jgi:nucleoside-diphosphate-sugar epimerase